METIQAIQKRINSIVVTQQISKAMLLVSNTKVQRARRLREETRPYYDESRRLLAAVADACRWKCGPYSEQRSEGATLYIVLGSDRGLCGAYNLNILKHVLETMRIQQGEAATVVVGTKIRDLLLRRGRKVLHTFMGIAQTPFYFDAKEIAAYVLDLFLKGEVCRVVLCYTEFESILRQHPRCMQLLPIVPQADSLFGSNDESVPFPAHKEEPAKPDGSTPLLPLMEFEPSAEAVLDTVVPQYLDACIFMALANGSVCEQSSRITSMDAAVKNSEELIEKLQLSYNQARQSAITQEVNEVVNGAEALRDSL